MSSARRRAAAMLHLALERDAPSCTPTSISRASSRRSSDIHWQDVLADCARPCACRRPARARVGSARRQRRVAGAGHAGADLPAGLGSRAGVGAARARDRHPEVAPLERSMVRRAPDPRGGGLRRAPAASEETARLGHVAARQIRPVARLAVERVAHPVRRAIALSRTSVRRWRPRSGSSM